MQFDDAVLAARRLAAAGRGAEDHVIMAALADRIAELEVQLAALTRECNIRQGGVEVLSETVKNQMRGLRNRMCQQEGLLDAQEKQIFHIKRLLPPRKRREEEAPEITDDERASS